MAILRDVIPHTPLLFSVLKWFSFLLMNDVDYWFLTIYMSSLEKCLFRSFACFFFSFFDVRVTWAVYINPLSVASLANIFSWSVVCVFIWFMVSFTPEAFNSVSSHLPIFVFIFIIIVAGLKKDTAAIYVSVLPTFSLQSFIVSSLTFRSSIHSEFLCTALGSVLISFLCMWLSSFPNIAY